MRAFLYCAGPAALAGFVPTLTYAPPAPATSVPAPRPAAIAMAHASAMLAAGDAAGGMRAFEQALVAEPRLALAHLGRAVCLAQMGRGAEAADALDATLSVAEGQEEVLYQLARMCAAEGQASIAISYLSAALTAIPALAEVAAADPLFRDHPAYLAAIGEL